MQITYKTNIVNAMAWRIVVDETETFFPIDGKVEFTRKVNNPKLKILYIISSPNGTDIEITYECTSNQENKYEDDSKKSPFKKKVPSSNRAQVTFEIPIN